MQKPKLALVSDFIRKDLQEPLEYFSKFEIFHLYKNLEWADLDPKKYSGLIKYRTSSELYSKLLEIKPDIIQGPEPYATRQNFFNTWIVAKVSKKLNTPFYFPMIENRPPKVKFGFLIGSLLEKYLLWYGKRAKKIIYLNNGAKKNLLSVGLPSQKLSRTRWACWVDANEFKPLSNKRFPTEPTLFYVGRLIAQKGIEDVIQAYKIIYENNKNFRLIIAGTGDKTEWLKDFIEKNKLDKAKLAGFVPNKELPKYFNDSFLTISPSVTVKKWEEQVGLVNLQSIACGTPVISTKSGAIPEYVPDGKAGILVYEHSPDQIAEAVLNLYNNQDKYLKMSQYGRQYILDRCDAKDCISELEDYLLKEVM